MSFESNIPAADWKFESEGMENQDPFWLLVPPPPDELKTDLWLAPEPFERTDRKESKLEELTEENAENKFK